MQMRAFLFPTVGVWRYQVNDQGALSDNYAKSNVEEQLSGAFTMELIIESVNDYPGTSANNGHLPTRRPALTRNIVRLAEIGTLQSREVQVTNAETG
eukprot:225033-Rhodomonas_salina.2